MAGADAVGAMLVLRSTAILCLAAACLLSTAGAGGIQRVARGEHVLLDLPSPHDPKLAVFTPHGRMLFLVDKRLKNPLMSEEAFLAASQLRLDTRSTRGFRFENGVEVSVDVFNEPGQYRFLVSDNLETGIANMRLVQIIVDYDSQPDPDLKELKFAVVSGVETFHRVRGENNLYPWSKARAGEIIISNACGFAEIRYFRVDSPGYSTLDDEQNLKPWKAFVRLGEWCRIQEFVLEKPTLVAYRDWKGKHYVVDYADLEVNDDRRLYLSDLRFIEEVGLAERTKGATDKVFLGDLKLER